MRIILISLCFQGRCMNFNRVPHQQRTRTPVWTPNNQGRLSGLLFYFIFSSSQLKPLPVWLKVFPLSSEEQPIYSFSPPAERVLTKQPFWTQTEPFWKKKVEQTQGGGGLLPLGLEVRVMPAGLRGPLPVGDVSSRLRPPRPVISSLRSAHAWQTGDRTPQGVERPPAPFFCVFFKDTFLPTPEN